MTTNCTHYKKNSEKSQLCRKCTNKIVKMNRRLERRRKQFDTLLYTFVEKDHKCQQDNNCNSDSERYTDDASYTDDTRNDYCQSYNIAENRRNS